MLVRKRYRIGFFLLALVTGCSKPEDAPTYDQMTHLLSNNRNDFEYLVYFIKQKGLTRITLKSVYPKGKIAKKDLIKYRNVLKKLGIYTGVQYSEDFDYVEVLYWSSGIVSRGKSKFYLYASKPISELSDLNQGINNNQLECTPIHTVDSWYICER